jgi:hypothetical protein
MGNWACGGEIGIVVRLDVCFMYIDCPNQEFLTPITLSGA